MNTPNTAPPASNQTYLREYDPQLKANTNKNQIRLGSPLGVAGVVPVSGTVRPGFSFLPSFWSKNYHQINNFINVWKYKKTSYGY